MSDRKQKRAFRMERQLAVAELNTIRCSLDDAYTKFNSTTDPDMLDAYIYEINALRARYNNALRRYRTRLEEAT